MAQVSGKTLVAKSLKNEGVTTVFTLSGGELMEIYDACVDEGIELVDMRHEQAVATAATGYATATRGPAVAMVTSGPGVVNMAPGMTAAWYAGAPVVGICTHTPHSFAGMGAFQEFDSNDMYRSITKWRGYCTSTRRIPEYVTTAFRHANTGRKRPVLLDFPDDTLALRVEEEQARIIPREKGRTTAYPYGDPEMVKRAVKWLIDAEKPGILIGSGILWSGASEELIRFAELLGIPVCYSLSGKGGIPDDHPLCGGMVAYNWGSIAGADVLLAIGVRFEEGLGYGRGTFYAPDVKVISVDIEPTEIGRNRPVDLGIWGDAKVILTQFIEVTEKALGSSGKIRKDTEWGRSANDNATFIHGILYSEASSSNKPIDPRRLAREVCDFVGKDSYIVIDGGDILAHTTSLYRAGFSGSFITGIGGTFGLLGGSIPIAIGVKTGKPDKRIVVVTGDGSFLFHGSEIDTAVRHNKQIVVVISNDCQWGMVRHGQQFLKLRDVCTKLNEHVRYDRYAESLGAYGELVTEPEEIQPALNRAFDSGLPAVLDVRTDPSIMSFA
ncbi:MAG: thiamine pyrophosphate-binding protein, partial [Dehalococcoidia bacterium]